MTSEVQICNMALLHVGAKSTIASLTESSVEARNCNLLYAQTRDLVLRDAQWGFATKYVTLGDLGSPPSGWDYRYQYPTDCIRAREIVNTANDTEIPYEIVLSSDGSSKNILCDQEDAVLKYTAKVTDPGAYDASFVQALAWRLAADLAMPLTKDPKRAQAAIEMYQYMIDVAITHDANEGAAELLNKEPDWISGRA